MKTTTIQQAIEPDKVCCAEFNPGPWDEVTHYWTDKLFIKSYIPELFHIPLPGSYNKAISRMWSKAEKAGAAPDPRDFLVLAYDPSPFTGELYMSVTKAVPGEGTICLSGIFFSKVFDGPYSKVPKFMAEMNTNLISMKKSAKKIYMYYAYCPKCSKKYGHNYMVALAEIA
jgi:hypothetical protein